MRKIIIDDYVEKKKKKYVIGYACQGACVKVANVNSVNKCSPAGGAGRGRLPSANKNTCVYLGGDV